MLDDICRELCSKSSAVAEMSDRLATIGVTRKVRESGGLMCPFPWGQLGLHPNTI